MAEYTALKPLLSDIANAIREKDGSTGTILANTFPDRIRGLQSGGIDTSDATASASDILIGKTAYVNGEKITGSINTVEKATPSISVDSAGEITASYDQPEGYVSAGLVVKRMQLPTQSAKTWTPTTSDQTISPRVFLTGTQTIRGDTNLIASNIKSGVSIFGVNGSLSSGDIQLSLLQYSASSTSKKLIFSFSFDTPANDDFWIYVYGTTYNPSETTTGYALTSLLCFCTATKPTYAAVVDFSNNTISKKTNDITVSFSRSSKTVTFTTSYNYFNSNIGYEAVVLTTSRGY